MKKTIVLMLAVILIITCISPVYCSAEVKGDFELLSREARVLSELGIYTAENESEHITRGNMIQAIVKLSGIELQKEDRLYYDVPLNSLYSKDITTAYSLGLLDAKVGGRLGIDNAIGYDESVKMIARLLGYEDFVETENYADIVLKIKALRKLAIADSSAITQGEAVLLLYNLLEENIAEGSSDNLAVNKSETVLTRFLHMGKIEGVVDSSNVSSLTGTAPETKVNGISVDGNYFVTSLENPEEYLGYRIEGYFKETNGIKEFLYIDKYDNEVTVIDDIDIIKISATEIEYFEGEKSKSENFSGLEDIVFNNIAVPYYDISTLDLDNFNGYIELVNNNSDKKIDVIKIYSYENYLIKSFGADSRIITKNDKGVLDFSEYEKTVIENYDGTIPDITSLGEDTVISVFDAGNKKYVKIIIASQNASGYICAMNENRNKIYIDDVLYYADADFFDIYKDKLENAKNIALLDFRNRVSAISNSENDFLWAYLCDVDYKNDLNELVRFKIFDTGGRMHVFELKDKVILDGEKTSAAKVYEYFTELDSENGKRYCKRQFIRYSLNSEGLINKLDSSKQTVYENEDCNDSVIVEETYYGETSGNYFANTNYVVSPNVKLFAIPTCESGKSKVENSKFDENDYFVVDGMRGLRDYRSNNIKLELADIDEAGVASLAAIELIKYDNTPPGGGYAVTQYLNVRSYMVDGIGLGLDSEGNVCPMLMYFSQYDGNKVIKSLADDNNVFMKKVYDENGKVVPDEYKPLSKGDVVRLRFDYSGKVIGVAVDFDVDRTDNGRFKTNTYYDIGIANVKTGGGIRMNYKTLSGAPQFDGTNVEEVFDLLVGKNWRLSRILLNGYITVYDRERDIIYAGGYDDILDYKTNSGELPVIILRTREITETGVFVIK